MRPLATGSGEHSWDARVRLAARFRSRAAQVGAAWQGRTPPWWIALAWRPAWFVSSSGATVRNRHALWRVCRPTRVDVNARELALIGAVTAVTFGTAHCNCNVILLHLDRR